LALGKIQPIESAAIVYLPQDFATGSGGDGGVEDWFDGIPTLSSIVATRLGRLGVVSIPIFSGRVYDDQKKLVALLIDALKLCKQCGAKVVSLTGLIPSATSYGLEVRYILHNRSPVNSFFFFFLNFITFFFLFDVLLKSNFIMLLHNVTS